MPPRGHAVHNLMNTYEEGLSSSNYSGLDGIKLAFEKHIEVLKDTAMRKMVMDILLSIGTNFILREGVYDARAMTGPIILLEHYDGENTLIPAMSSSTEKIGYMGGVAEKDTIHFYRKRISCSCLKKRYSQVKKCQERGAECFRCKKMTNRETLKACSRCKYAQYCSKECQVADWPSHKAICKQMCDVHKFTKKSKK